jgi:hypothetical protein
MQSIVQVFDQSTTSANPNGIWLSVMMSGIAITDLDAREHPSTWYSNAAVRRHDRLDTRSRIGSDARQQLDSFT